MIGAWHGGKGDKTRREDRAKVEANWPENWSARETERQQDQAFVEQQRAENLRRADASNGVCAFLDADGRRFGAVNG